MDRETAASYLTKGNQLKRAGKLKEAIASYKRAIEINPHLAWSHHKLGEALAKIGLLDEAIISFRKAIEINPKSAWSYYQLGEVFAIKGEYNAAISNYRHACELEPDFEGFSRGLEKALKKLGDRPQIPEKGRGFFEEAKTHFANGLWQETITSCRQAIEAGVEDLECYKMLAWSLKKRRQWEKAIAAYSKLIELNPTDGEGYYWWGEILKIQGKLGEAIAVYKKGLEKQSENPQLASRLQQAIEEHKYRDGGEKLKAQVSDYRASGKNHQQAGNIKEAISAYRKAINIEQNPYDYRELGMLLLEAESLDEAVFCYEKLLENSPWLASQIKPFLSLGVALVNKGKIQEIIAAYQKVFQNKIEYLDAYSQLSMRLAQMGHIKEAVLLFQEWPKPKNATNLAPLNNKKKSRYDSIWERFNSQSFPNNLKEDKLDADLDGLAEKYEEINEYFQKQKQNLNILVVGEMTEEDKRYLRDLGISREYIQLIPRESNSLENLYINAFNNEASSITERTQFLPHKNFSCWHRINQSPEFTNTIAEFNYMYVVDPMTGKTIRSNQSFFAGESIIYRFEGREIFYILTGTFTGEKISVYFPKFELVLCYDVLMKNDSRFLINLKAYIVAYIQEVIAYFNAGDRRLLTSIIGFVKNLGHFFWQDVNGIYYLHQNQLLGKIDRLAIGPYEPLELTSVMPEVEERKILKVPKLSSVETFRFFLNNNYFCLRMTEHFIGNDYVAKIRKAAREKCSESFLKTVKEIRDKKESFPLLWINVRGHNKSWVSQEKGYATIVNKLSDDFPKMGIVIDGWIDCNEVVEKITARLKPNIKVYNTLGCPLHESIVWASYIDAYIAVVGSGLVLTSWLNDKPGVAYGDRGHLKQKNFWAKVKENAVEPAFIDFEDITQLEQKGWSNFKMDWQAVFNRILPILKQIKP